VLCSVRLFVRAAIEPAASGGIVSLCSNANCVTRHSFFLSLNASIKADASVSVDFPAEYTATNLGVTACSGFTVASGTTTVVPCAVVGRTVTWTVGQTGAGTLVVGVDDIMNPGQPGTTGYFKVRTFMSAYQVESNEAFATVGITFEPTSFKSSSLLTTSAVLNTVQTYTFQLTSLLAIPAGAWFRIKFPSGYSLDGALACTVGPTAALNVQCAAQEIGSKWVVFSGLSTAIPAGSFTLSMGGVKNPPQTGQFGFIQIQLLSSGVFNVLQISSFLQSPVIGPGLISAVKVEGAPLTQGQEIWYTVTATVSNQVPVGGYFRVIFPPEFGGVTNCIVASGFVSATAGGTVTCNFKRDINSVFLSGFQTINPGAVAIRVKAVNPGVAASSNFVLQSMLANGNFIDVNNAAGTLKFTSIPAPGSISVEMFSARVPRVQGESGPLELYLQCKALLPNTPLVEAASPATIGQVIVDLPSTTKIVSGITDQTGTVGNDNASGTLARLSCLFGKNRDRAMRCEWDNTNQLIIIDTPSNIGLENCPMAITITPIGYNGSSMGFYFPDLGSQTVKIQTKTKSVDGPLTLREEANLNLQIPPKQFNSPTGVAAPGSVVVTPLHNLATLYNLLKIAVTPSIDLPVGFALEFEFAVSGGFPSGLALDGVSSGDTVAYPCFYDAAWGTFASCQIKVGSATSPTVVQLLNAGAAILAATAVAARTANTPWTVYFPHLLNGSAGSIPSLTVRSKISSGDVIETQTVTLAALVAATPPNLAGPTLSPTTALRQTGAVEVTFNIPLAASLAPGDQVYFYSKFPFGAAASPKVFSVAACTTGLAGVAADYMQFSSEPLLNVLYTAAATISTPFTTCLKVPETMYYAGTVTVSVYVVRVAATSVSELGDLTLTISTTPLANAAISEIYADTTQSLLNHPHSLYRIDFDTVGEINPGGSISILFPATSFTAVHMCYDMTALPSTAVCKAEQSVFYNALTYHRVVISGWTADFVATANLKVWVAVNSGNTSGAASIVVLTNWDNQSVLKVVDIATLTLTLSTVSAPTQVSVAPFLSPYLSHRTNEFAPLVFPIVPTSNLTPSTSSTAYTFVKVSLPTSAIKNIYDPAAVTAPVSTGLSWAPAAGSWLYCTFNNVQASKCEISGNDVSAYTPTSGTFASGSLVMLKLTTMDATLPHEVGFKAPAIEGNYQFKVGIYTGTPDTLQKEATTWFYLGSGRFTNLSVTSHNKGAGQYTAMQFSFKAGTALAASSAGGSVMLEFPYDALGNGKGWASDLGTGLPNNSPIDCIAGAGTVAATQFACTLLTGTVDYVRIHVSSFNAVAVGGLFDFTIAGIKNPTAVMYDMNILVRSSEYDSTTDSMNPVRKYKDMAWLPYVETTYTVVQATATDNSASNALSDTAQSSATANIALNILSASPEFVAEDKILVQLPAFFTLPTALTVCTYPGATGSTCIPFPLTHWVLVTLKGTPTAGTQLLTIGPVTNPPYSSTIVVTAYLLKDRKNTNKLTITFPASVAIPSTLVLSGNSASLKLVAGLTERYCFKMQLKNPIPKTGSVEIAFPVAYTGIDRNSCMLGDETTLAYSSPALSCVLTGTNLRLSGFQTGIIADTFIEICVNTVNPAAGTHQPFDFNTYYTGDSSARVETFHDTTGSVIVPGTLMPSFTAGVQYQPSVQVSYVSGGTNTGPLVLGITPGVKVIKDSGTVKIASSIAITLPTDGELRCIWAAASSESLSECTLAANEILITAPKTQDLEAATAYTLTLTSVNAQVQNGLVWGAAGTAALDLEIKDTSGGSVYGNSRVYVNVSPVQLAKLTVDWDHQNSDLWNRFTVTLDLPTGLGIPAWTAGGRILVEFPPFFTHFGYVKDNSEVSCVLTTLTAAATSALHCYLQKGDSAIDKNAAIIVSGFDAVAASATGLILDFDSLKNPVDSGDNKIVWVQVTALDVSAGWPGVPLARKRVDNLFALNPVTPSDVVAAKLAVATQLEIGGTGAKYTVELKSPGAMAAVDGDIYYVVFKEGNEALANISVPTVLTTALTTIYTPQYYPFFKFAVIKMKAIADISTPVNIDLTGFTNPPYQPETMYYHGYYIHNKQVAFTFNSKTAAGTTPVLTTINSAVPTVLRSDGLTPFYQNDILDWKFTIALAKALPKNGALVITLTSSSFEELFCYSDASNGSALIGTYTCTIAGKVATLIPTSDAQPASTSIVVTALVKAGTVADSVTFKTKTDTTATVQLIEQPTAIAVAVDLASAPTFHKIPQPTRCMKRSIRADNVGSFKFSINIKTPLTQNLGVLEVTLPDFAVALGGELRCIWGLSPPQLASSCEATGASAAFKITMKAPALSDVTTGVQTVTITTVNADDPEGQGLKYPATGKNYNIGVTAKGNGTVVSQTGSDELVLLSTTATITNLKIDYGHRGNDKLNYVKFTFEAGTTDNTGRIRIMFPTRDNFGNDLFEPDLGLGVACTDTFPCHTKNLGTPTCTLNCGMPHIDRPTFIEVTSLGALAATTTEYTISIDGLKNPIQAGTDDRLIYFRIMILNAAEDILASQTNYYAYSVLENGTPSNEVGTAPDFTGKPYAAAATLAITLPTTPNPPQDITSKYIFIFPFPLDPLDTLAGTPTATGEVHSNTKWGLINSPAGGPLTAVTVTFAGGNLGALYVGAVIRVLIITAGKLVADINLPAATSSGDFHKSATEVTALPVYHSSAGKMYKGDFGNIMLHYALEKPIPANGCIKFAFATATVDNFCTVSEGAAASLKSSWKCGVNTNVLSFTGLGALIAGNNILVVTRASFTAADIGGISVQTFADNGCTQKIETDAGGATTTPPIAEESTDLAPPNVYFRAPTPVTRLAIKSKKADFAFNFTPISALTASASHHIKLTASPEILKVATGRAYPSCSIANGATKIPAPCAFAGADLNIYPGADLAAGTTYRIDLTTQGEDGGVNGFVQPSTNVIQTLTLNTYQSQDETTVGDMGIITFATPDTEFTSLKVTPAHVSKGHMNIFTFEIVASVGLASSDALIFEFPGKTEDGTLPLFTDDLGLNVPTGTTISLKLSATFTTPPTCFLKKGSAGLGVPARIKCKGGVATSGATLSVEIPAVNPTPADVDVDKTILHFRVYIEDSNQLIKAERWVMNAIGLDATAPTSTSEPTVDWLAGTAPTFGATSQSLDVTFSTTPLQIILVGGGLDLTTTSTASNWKYTGANVLHFTGTLTSTLSIAGLTAPLTAAQPTVKALILLANVSGRIIVDSVNTSTLTAAVSPPAVTGTVSTAVAVPPTSPNVGNWYLQTLSFTTTTDIPVGSYLVYKIVGGGGTYADVDPSFLQFKANFPNSSGLKWKYDGTTHKTFQVWNLPTLAHTDNHDIQVYVKWATGTFNEFAVEVYLDSGLTSLWGSKVSTASTAAPTLSPVAGPVSLTASDFKVGATISVFTLTFKPTTGITSPPAGAGVYLDLSPGALNCDSTSTLTGVTLAVGTGPSTPMGSPTYTTKVAYGKFTADLATTSPITVVYTFGTPGCTPNAAGYLDINFNTDNDAVAGGVDWGSVRIFIQPSVASTAFTLETYVANAASWSMVHINLQLSTAYTTGDVLVFSFPVTSSTGLGVFSDNLGLADSGNEVPISSLNTGLGSCVLKKGSTAHFASEGFYSNARIDCVASGALDATLDLVFPKLLTPSVGNTASLLFEVAVYSGYNYVEWKSFSVASGYFTGSACVAGASPASIAVTPSVATTYYSTASYTLSFTLSGPLVAAIDDYLLVEFGPSYDVSGVSPSADVKVITSPTPYILVKLTSTSVTTSTAPSITITGLKNPAPGASTTLTVYPNLKGLRKCADFQAFTASLTPHTLTAPAFTNMGGTPSIFYPNQDILVKLIFTTPSDIPATGSIEVTFPTGFGAVDYAQVEATGLVHPTYGFATSILTISGFTQVASGTAITLSYLYAPLLNTATAGALSLDIKTKVGGSVLGSTTASVTVTVPTSKYLLSTQFSSRLGALFGKDASDTNGTLKVMLRLHFKTIAAVDPGTDNILIDFTSNLFSKSGVNEQYFAYYQEGTSRFYSPSVTHTGLGPYTITVKSPAKSGLAATTEYDLYISANNFAVDGLNPALTSENNVKVTSREDTAGTVVLHIATGLTIPGAKTFQEFFVQPFTLHAASEKPYWIHFKSAVAVPIANGEIVIQFPSSIFGNNPFPTTLQGELINCGVTVAGIYKAATCKGFQGDSTNAVRVPAYATVSGIDVAIAGAVDIVLASIKTPAAGAIGDVTVLTREIVVTGTDAAAIQTYSISQFMVYRNAMISQGAAAAGSIQPWASVGKISPVIGASTTYTITLEHTNFDIDTLLVSFPAPYPSDFVSGCTVTTPAGATLIPIPGSKSLLISLALRSAQSATPLTITLTGVKNVSYIPATPSDAALTIYSSAFRLFTMTTVTFSGTIPTPPWTEAPATMISNLANGSIPVNNNKVNSGFVGDYALQFKFGADIPKDGAFQFEFPSEYQGVSPLAYALGSAKHRCTEVSGVKGWLCAVPSLLAKDTPITIYGRGMAPTAPAATTNQFKMAAYTTSGKTELISKSDTAGIVTVEAGTFLASPWDFYVPHQSKWNEETTKAGDTDVLVFTFKPTTSLVVASGTVILKPSTSTFFPAPTTSGTPIALFQDTATNVEYLGSACVRSGAGVWTATVPPTKVIDNGTIWRLVIRTINSLDEAIYGFQYPDDTSANSNYNWEVELSSLVKFNELVYNIKAKPTTGKIKPVVAHQDYANSFYRLELKADLTDNTEIVTLVFPLISGTQPLFDKYLGQSPVGDDLGCDSDQAVWDLSCKVVASRTTYSTRDLVRLQIKGTDTLALPYKIYLGGIKNPATVGGIPWVAVQIWSSAGQILAHVKMDYLFQTSAPPTVSDQNVASSFVGKLTTADMKKVDSTAGTTTGFALGVALNQGDFIVLVFSHEIDSGSGIATHGVATIAKTKTIACIAGTALTSTDLFDMTGLRAPAYVQAPTLTVYVYSGLVWTRKLIFNDPAAAYTPYAITNVDIKMPLGGTPYMNVLREYEVELKLPKTITENAGFKLTFPTGFALRAECSTTSWDNTASAVNKGSMPCSVSGSDAIVGFEKMTYTTDVLLKVRVWGTPGTGFTSPLTVSAVSYINSPTNSQQNGIGTSGSLAIATNPNTIAFSSSRYVTTSPRAVSRGDDYGAFTFSFKSATLLTKAVGTLTVTLPTTLLLPPASAGMLPTALGDYRCLWRSSAGSVYLAKTCAFAVAAGGDALTVTAPLNNDIAASQDWTVTAFTLNLVSDGFKFAAASYGYHQIKAEAKGDGVASGDIGYTRIFIAPKLASEATLKHYSNTAGMPTALKFHLKPSTAVPAGLEVAAGTALISLVFNPDVVGENFGSPLVATEHQTDGVGLTDCVSITSFTNAKCYIRRGDITNKRPTEVLVRGFASIATTDLADLLVVPLFNPAVGKIVSVVAFVETFAAGVYTAIQYMEFPYLYTTVAGTAVDASGTAVYTSGLVQGTASTLTFSVAASPLPVNTDNGLALFTLTEPIASLTGITLTSETPKILAEHNSILVLPVATLAASVAFGVVPLPTYVIAQHWSGYFMNKQATVKYQTYTASTTVNTLASANIVASLVETLASAGPFTNRANLFTLRIKPVLKVPKGGAIQISFPAALGDASPSCTVEGGLQGPFACVYAAGSQVLRITGFDLYDGTVATTPAILVSTSLTPPAAAASASYSFAVKTYGVSPGTTEEIESGSSAALTLVITAAQPGFLTSVAPMMQGQWSACLGEVGVLTFQIKPRATYAYNYEIVVEFPLTVNLAATAVVSCSLNDGVNTVTLPTTRAYAASIPGPPIIPAKITITAKVPEQMPMQTTTLYNLSINVYDTGSMATDGFTLPTLAEVETPAMSGKSRYHVQVKNSAGTLVEAQKVGQPVCGPAFSSAEFSLRLGTLKKDAVTFLDLAFKPATAVSQTGAILIELPTSNGLGNLWPIDLGLGVTVPTAIPCEPAAGFTSTTALKCMMSPVAVSGPTSPVKIHIYNFGAALATTDTHRVLIAKVKNPSQHQDSVFSQNLISRIRVAALTSYTLGKAFVSNELTVRYPSANPFNVNDPTPQPTGVSAVFTGVTGTAEDPKTLTYTLKTNTLLSLNTGYIVLEIPPVFILPASVTCGGLGTTCTIMKITDANWLIAEVATGTSIADTTVTAELRAPEWKVTAGYPIIANVYSGAGLWTDTMTATVASIPPRTSVLTVSSNFSKNKNTYDYYTLTIAPVVDSIRLTRVVLKFPPQYQWLDNTCTVTGLNAISETNPISCVSDCATLPCLNTITITNFKDTTPSDDIVVKIGAFSPSTAGTTGDFEATLYALPTGTDGAIETFTGLPQTILDIDFPVLAWLDLVQSTQFDRLLKAGSTGDLNIRLTPKIPVPAGGSFQVILPDGFAPPTGTTPYCLLESGMLYYATNPRDTGRSDLMVMSACTYASATKTVTVPLPPARVKEWNGFGTRCSMIIISASNSAGVATGITTPTNPGYYSLTVTSFSGTTQLESSTPTFYLNAPKLDSATYSITQVTKTLSAENVLKFAFKVAYDTPVGYLTFASNIPQEMATIELTFETYQSFATDLGKGYIKGSSVPCTAIAGLVANGQLQCTFVPGDMTPTTPLPAKVLVNNFQAIKAATAVEIHLLRILNPATTGYVPKLWVSVYKVSYDEMKTGIAYQSAPLTPLPAVTNDVPAVVGVVTGVTLNLAVKTVDGTGLLQVPFKLDTAMAAGDQIFVSFPSSVLLPETGLTVAIKDYTVSAAPVPAGGTLGLQVYSAGSLLLLTLPALSSLAIATSYSIEITGFLNPPYLDSCASCPLTYYTSVSSLQKNSYASTPNGNFWTDLGLIAGQVTGFTFTATPDLKVDTINAQYVIKFSTAPRIPTGSTLQVTLPTQFPALGSRTPAAKCSSSLANSTCVVLTNSVQITGFGALASGVAVTVTIQGGKNPGLVDPVTGFTVVVLNPQGKQVISHALPLAITFVAQDPVAALTYSLVPESYSSAVSPNYLLKASSAVALPVGTVLSLPLPLDFAVSGLKCVNLVGLSSFRSCALGNSNTIQITLNESVAASTALFVTFQGLKNPSISTTGTSGQRYGPISLKAVYDGKVLAASSDTAATSFLTITPPPSRLVVTHLSVSPRNEVETGLYNLTLTMPAFITAGDNVAIRVLFPASYTKQLVPSGTQLYCAATPSVQKCARREPNEVRFEVFQSNLPVSSTVNLVIYGVANPPTGETGQFGVQVVNQTDGAVISATDSAGFFRFLSGPRQLLVLSMSLDDQYAGSYTNLNLNIDTNLTSLVANGEILIDWPTEYSGLFTQSSYPCQVTSKIVSANNCTWLLETNRMRTSIAVSAPTARNYQSMRDAQQFSIRLIGVPNPKAAGKTAPFGVKYLDKDTNLVLASSYENAGNNTLTLKAGSETIAIPTIQQTLTVGTYSQMIPVELGLSPYNPVTIRLSSNNPGLIFFPREMVLQYTWNTKTAFQVGALRTARVGTFSVVFTKYEGDSIQRFQPLQNLQIVVQPAAGLIPVTIGAIPDQPTQVESLPIPITLAARSVYPVSVSIVTGQGSNITATPATVVIPAGEQSGNFTLTYSDNAVSGTLNGTVIGDSRAPYVSETTSVAFKVIPNTIQPLSLLLANVSTIGRVSASAEIRLSAKAQLWYMYSKKGTRAPTADQLRAQQRVRSDAQQSFGRTLADLMVTNTTSNTSYFLANLPMNNLKDKTKYMLYYVYEGQDKVVSQVGVLDFTTLQSYPPARFTVYTVLITNPNDILIALCQVLGVPRSLLMYLAAASVPGQRRLQSDISYEFVMTMDRSEEAPAPLTQIAKLDTPAMKGLLQQYLPSFNPTPSIAPSAAEYNATVPLFTSFPGIAYITNSTVTVNITQNTDGQIYGVILERNATPPNAEQILNGLNGDNIAVPREHIAIAECLGNHSAWLKFTGLQYFLRYRVWFAGTNNLPGSPIVTPDNEVVYLNLTAGKLISTVQQQTVLLTWADQAAVLATALALFLF